MSCYDGPAGTAGVGVCKAGVATCLADGSGFGPCEGQVLPLPEDCQTAADEDCDGVTPACPGAGQPRWITALPLTVGTTAHVRVVGLAAHPGGNTLLLLELAANIDIGLGLVQGSTGWCGRTLLLVALDELGKPIWQLPFYGGVRNPVLDIGTEGSIWLAGINVCPGSALTPNQGIFLMPVTLAGALGTPWFADSFQINALAMAVSGPAAGVLTEGWSYDGAGMQTTNFGVQLSSFSPGSPPVLFKSTQPTPTYGEHAIGRAGTGFAVYGGQGQNGFHQIEAFDAALSPTWIRTLINARVLAADTIDPVLVIGGELVGTESFGPWSLTSNGVDGFLTGYHAATGTALFVVQIGGSGDQVVASVGGGGGSFAAAILADPTTFAGTSVEGGVVLRMDATGNVAWIRSVLAKPGGMRVAVAKDGSVIVAGTYRGGSLSGYPVPAQEGLAVMTLEP